MMAMTGERDVDDGADGDDWPDHDHNTHQKKGELRQVFLLPLARFPKTLGKT